MSKEYQTKKGHASRMPRNIYLTCLYLLRSAENVREAAYRSFNAARVEQCINDAYATIPEQAYKDALHEYFEKGTQIRFLAPKYATSEKTISRWKFWLIYTVAKNLELI